LEQLPAGAVLCTPSHGRRLFVICTADGVLFGAAVSLNRMVDVLSEQAKEHPKRARLLAV
jgi:hypothetical protein